MAPSATDTAMHVLLVEDEPSLAAFIHKGLTEESFTVETAADGETALDLARSDSYDIVILDIMLPGSMGLRCVRGSAPCTWTCPS